MSNKKRPTEDTDTDGSHAPAWEPAPDRSSGVPTLERGNDQMADLHPLLTKRAGGRDISGLSAYEQ